MGRPSEYYPVFLKLKNKKCVVIGGGKVAERKVKGLLGKGALVTVISLSLTQELERLERQGEIKVRRRGYRASDLQGALLAMVATDNKELNRSVAREGRAKGVLINVVDNLRHSDFISPSIIERDDVIVAISTSGRSPALARKLRVELENYLGQEIGALAILLSEVREELKKQGKHPKSSSWQRVLDLPALQAKLRERKLNEIREELVSLLSAES
jgi:precorrin-2 dehydrogenase/sirohydrochlorin ferrochelatase